MPRSTIDKINQKKNNEKILGEISSEYIEDYKHALNSIAASENGQLVFKTLIKVLGVFNPERGGDLAALIRTSEKKNVYLELIRPHLEPEIRQELER